MALRVYPINSSEDASTVPGVNDFDLTRFPTEFLTEGIKQSGFAVSEHAGTPNMSVDIAPGFALIEIENTNVEHGRTYKTWFESTEIETKSIEAADSTNPRKDRVILRIDVSADPNVNASNIAVIEVLTGTPAGSPSAPAVPANAISLAIVDVPASDTSITDDQITDGRIYIQMNSAVLRDVARVADLLSTLNGKGASTIGVEDADGNFTATNVEGVLTEVFGLIDAVEPSSNLAFAGDGSDGDVTLSMDTTITKDMNYDTLDLAGYTLNMAGYKVFAKRITDSVGGGKLKAPTGGAGGNGSNASGATAGGGGTAGSAASGVTLPDSTAGVTGGGGGNGASNNNGSVGSNGTAGNSVTNSLGTTSGAVGASGGSGGTSSLFTSPQAGGLGGAAGTAAAMSGRKSISHYHLFVTNKATTFTVMTGAGSGSGAGGGAGGNGNSGSTGGGGGGAGGTGGNGGYWLVGCSVADGDWDIESIGGAGGTGGNGGNATGSNAGGGGGGAGGTGGSGGSGVFISNDKTAWTGSLVLTGGAGGTGGSPGTTSGGGTAASAGSTGTNGSSGIGLQIAA